MDPSRVNSETEEDSCNQYAVSQAPSLAPARGSAKRPSVPTVLGESEKPLLVLRRRGAVILLLQSYLSAICKTPSLLTFNLTNRIIFFPCQKVTDKNFPLPP